jgi:hypothetical protein
MTFFFHGIFRGKNFASREFFQVDFSQVGQRPVIDRKLGESNEDRNVIFGSPAAD